MNSFENFDRSFFSESKEDIDANIETEKNRKKEQKDNEFPEKPEETAGLDSVFLNEAGEAKIGLENEGASAIKNINYLKSEEYEGASPMIPKKVHRRLLDNILKLLSREKNNHNLRSASLAENVLYRAGIKPDSPLFNRLIGEAELLLEIDNKEARDRSREILEERKREEERSVGRELKEKGIWKMPEHMQKYEREEEKKEELKRNKHDIRWADKAKNHIRENKDNPEGIKNLWEGIETIYTRQKTKRGQYEKLKDYKRVKNGILSELAAENLFLKWKDYLEEKHGTEKNPLAEIEFSITKATPEEDAMRQTDFFISFKYEGEEITLPVQVKSSYSEKGLENRDTFSRQNVCNFRDPHTREEKGVLSQKMHNFFRKNASGIFIIIPHGYDGLDISESGEPSEELQKLFYAKLEKELSIFLIRWKNMKAYEEKYGSSRASEKEK